MIFYVLPTIAVIGTIGLLWLHKYHYTAALPFLHVFSIVGFFLVIIMFVFFSGLHKEISSWFHWNDEE